MKKQSKSEIFLKKIFERSENPMMQLERINSIVPIFFSNPENVLIANQELEQYGYQINNEYIENLGAMMMSHPACSDEPSPRPSGHPCCAINKENCKMLLLVPKNRVNYHETRN